MDDAAERLAVGSDEGRAESRQGIEGLGSDGERGATLSQRHQPLWAQVRKAPPTAQLRGRRVKARCALDLLRSIFAVGRNSYIQ